MTDAKDASNLALETLLSVGREIAPDIPEELLRRVFALQRVHQFDGADRSASAHELQRAVEDYVAQLGKLGATE